jgi:signal transduction histidine kinase
MRTPRFIDHVSDAMLALSGSVVCELNDPARRLFATDETFHGRELSVLFARDPALADSHAAAMEHYRDVAGVVEGGRRHFDRDHPTIERLLAGGNPETVDPDIGLFVDGSLEYFHLTTSALDDAGFDADRLLTFRRITHLKERERDLDFLMQVMTRVLRHNLRNDLTVARGYAATIEERVDDPVAGMAAQIRETCGDLVETSEKARRIQEAVTADTTAAFDVPTVVREAVGAVAADSAPDAEFTVDVPDARVEANPELPHALEDCVENGARYSDAETPRVDVTAERDGPWLCLHISDNGPGIPDRELEALTERGETDLVHGSGAGLWLTHTVAEESGGSVTYDTDDGTTVSIRLPAAEE